MIALGTPPLVKPMPCCGRRVRRSSSEAAARRQMVEARLVALDTVQSYLQAPCLEDQCMCRCRS